MTESTGEIPAAATIAYRSAYIPGLLLVIAATFFIAKVTAQGSPLAISAIVLCGLGVIGLWLRATRDPSGRKPYVIGMWVLSTLLACWAVLWVASTDLAPAVVLADLLSSVATPFFAAYLLSWALELKAEPAGFAQDPRRRRLRRRVLDSLLRLALVTVLPGVLFLTTARLYDVVEEPAASIVGALSPVAVAAAAVVGLPLGIWGVARALWAYRQHR